MPRIDTHHHMASPRSLGPLQEAGIIMKHDAEAMNAARALEEMDRGAVTAAINSTPALRGVVGLDHAVFGSDYPWSLSANCVRELKEAGVLSADERDAIDYRNIAPLLPRFRF